MADNGLTVIKLGGSHAFSPPLKAWLGAIVECAGHAVIVPGGGPFADVVRVAQPKIGFDDAAAHRMALLAMEQYACALASLNGKLVLAESAAEIARAVKESRVPVWLPTKMVLAAKEIPWSWDVTSDSLAAWLAGTLHARRLLLVKHGEAAEGPLSATALATSGIVDAAFPRFLAAAGVAAFILGPGDYVMAVGAIRDGTAAGTPIDPC